jgi:hypothetical protein
MPEKCVKEAGPKLSTSLTAALDGWSISISIYFVFVSSIGVMTPWIRNLSIQRIRLQISISIPDVRYNTINFRIQLSRQHSNYNVIAEGLY